MFKRIRRRRTEYANITQGAADCKRQSKEMEINVRNSLKLNMSNNKRNRKAIKLILEGKVLTTIDIHDALNLKFKQGPTMNQVGNLLSRTPGIVKVGMIDLSMGGAGMDEWRSYHNHSQRIRVAVWKMKTD